MGRSSLRRAIPAESVQRPRVVLQLIETSARDGPPPCTGAGTRRNRAALRPGSSWWILAGGRAMGRIPCHAGVVVVGVGLSGTMRAGR